MHADNLGEDRRHMLDRDLPPISPPKLPLGYAIKASFLLYFTHFGQVLRATWLWLIIAVPLFGYSQFLYFSKYAELISATKWPQRPPGPEAVVLSLSESLITLAAGILMSIAYLSLMVAWSRFIVLAERPGIPGSNLFSRALWSPFVVSLQIGLVCFAPIFLMIFLMSLVFPSGAKGLLPPMSHAFSVTMFVFIMTYLYAIGAIFRLYILLPARASGDRTLTLLQTWRLTRGNTWRIIWGILACSMVSIGVYFTILFLVGLPVPTNVVSDGFVTRFSIALTIAMAMSLITPPLMIGFIAITYRHFRVQPLQEN
jgi:hypothetical protein